MKKPRLWKFNSSIRNELLLTFLVVAIIPLFFLMFASHRVAVSLVEAQLGNSMKQTVEQLNININGSSRILVKEFSAKRPKIALPTDL